MACRADSAFGPVLHTSSSCRRFDFTVTFEDAFFALGPNAIVLPVAILRSWHVLRRLRVVEWPLLQRAKIVTFLVLGVLSLAELGCSATKRWPSNSDLTIAASAVAAAAAGSLAVLSALEHSRSPRPSMIIQGYLVLVILLDVARVRTAWLIADDNTPASLRSASVAVNLLALLLESTSKTKFIAEHQRDKLSAEDMSGLFSRSFLWWLNPLFRQGYFQQLSSDDLPRVGADLAAAEVGRALSQSWKKTQPATKHRLAVALAKAFAGHLLWIQVPRLALVGFAIAQPFLVEATLNYVDNSSTTPVQTGYGLIGATILTYMGIALSTVWYQQLIFRLMTMIRGALISVIFEHSITLPASADGDGAAGPISLVSSDVERVTQTLQWVLNILPNAVQVALGLWILSNYMGAVCIAPLVVALACGLLAGQVGKRIPPRQRSWMQAIQKRVKATTNVLNNIKSVSMSGISEIATQQIHGLRKEEIEKQKAFRRLQVTMITMGNMPAMLAPAITFTAFAIAELVSDSNQFQITSAFTSLALLSILINPVAELVTATTNLTSALGCLERIEAFLQKDSQRDSRLLSAAVLDSTSFSTEIELQPVDGQLLVDAADNTATKTPTVVHPATENEPWQHLTSLNQVKLIRITNGSFGWNLSSPILHSINMEVLPSTLTIVTGPTGSGKSSLLRSILGETCIIAEPWILNASIKENVLGISDYDGARYRKVVEACQLDDDFTQLVAGDDTMAGSQGSALSGGQRQRIVSRSLEAARLTHQAVARAVYSQKQLVIMDDPFSGLDPGTSARCFHALLGPHGLLRQDGMAVVFATHNAQWFPHADQLIVLDKNGRLVSTPNAELTSRSSESPRANPEITKIAQEPDVRKVAVQNPANNNQPSTRLAGQKEMERKRLSQDSTIQALRDYMVAMGPTTVFFFFLLILLHIGCSAAQPLWLKFWTEANEKDPNSNVGQWTGVYVLLAVATVSFICLESGYFLLRLVPRSAINLHLGVLNTTMRAPLAFFTSGDTGKILNLFTGDLTLVDLALPLSFILAFEQITSAVAELILTSISSGYLAISIPFVGMVLYVLQRIYLRTSRQLRILDLELKAPLLNHFMTSFDGLVTIRAFCWKAAVEKENMKLLDASQSPFYLIYCLQRWLTLVLDLMTAGLATILVGLAVALRTTMDTGYLGVALVSVMTLGQVLSAMIVHWTNLETSLGAITRIKKYERSTPTENDEASSAAHSSTEDWPQRGEIVFTNVSASYGSQVVLDHINLHLKAGLKTAICGRSGSGKSTLLSLILRLYEPSCGTVTIDGVDLSTVTPHYLRSILAALPQEPFFLSGSVRLNLDPLSKHDDDSSLWTALDKTGLATLIRENGGLDVELNTDWLSTGQKQLMCLARVLLRGSRVVLLDEPTSQIDTQAEQLVHDLIKTELAHCTVVMVSHHVKVLAGGQSGFDQVIVLKDGQVAEIGSPEVLARTEHSVFRELVEMEN